MKSISPYLLCFGDSLTAGYQSGPGGFGLGPNAPYGGFIQEWVGVRAEIVVAGICGELTREMVTRFPRDVVEVKPTVTVILGGTNDLGSGVPPIHISENLQRMYRLALDAGIEPVGVTVPSICVEDAECGMGLEDSERSIPPWVHTHIDQRLVLNQRIAEACRTFNMTCLDLFAETSEGPTHLLLSRFASDGLHFNAAGYEVFARLVWRHVLAEPFGACPPSR